MSAPEEGYIAEVRMTIKGIVLAGGSGTRLYPLTVSVNKHLLPVYDRPLIYYSLSTLMLSGVRDILLITNERSLPGYRALFGNGSDWGVSISYAEEQHPKGTACAFTIGRRFIGSDEVALVLGDNIFYSFALSDRLLAATRFTSGATLFACHTAYPERYGVVQFDELGHAVHIEEKPTQPKSSFAITGLYFYDNQVLDVAAELKPSARGEFEVTDVNRTYLEQGNLKVEILGGETIWIDAGTHDSLLSAGVLVSTIESLNQRKACCPEEIAFQLGYIDSSEFERLAYALGQSSYGLYLQGVLGRTL